MLCLESMMVALCLITAPCGYSSSLALKSVSSVSLGICDYPDWRTIAGRICRFRFLFVCSCGYAGACNTPPRNGCAPPSSIGADSTGSCSASLVTCAPTTGNRCPTEYSSSTPLALLTTAVMHKRPLYRTNVCGPMLLGRHFPILSYLTITVSPACKW